jgi:hypothetical protein
VQYAVSLPILFASGSPAVTIFVSTFGATVGYMVVTPFQAALVALVYFDLRVRKEGLDLELVAERLGAQAPGGPPAAAHEPQPVAAPEPAQAGAERLWSGPSEPQPPSGWLPPAPDR